MGAEEECVQFVAALMDDKAQILMRSVQVFTMMACELHDHIVRAFVLEKSPLPLADSTSLHFMCLVWSEDHSGLFSGAHLQLESLLFRYFQP